MDLLMKDNLKKDVCMVMEFIIGLMENIMKVIGKIIKCKALVKLFGQMEGNT